MKASQIIILALVALIAIGVCVIAGVLLLRSPGDEVTPTAVAEVTEAPAVPSNTPEAETPVDDSWQRIQAAGTIVVGTSVDYPPFEYYVDTGSIDGFDIALMDEIGRRLGVQIDYRDIAFDGLGSALQVGQIDAAIAAISVTPERQAVIGFSNVYFVGEDAILARADSNASIGTAGDLAAYKVGVQRNTVYQSWVQQTLVDSGQMPADHLLAYERAEDAVRDLGEQRVDLVMLDAQPAEVETASGSFKLVGRGLNQQRLAIALPKGAASLQAEIDRVLLDLSNEGFVSQLAKQYLDLEVHEMLPTPTPTPQPEVTSAPAATATPGPAPSCVDAMALVQHLTQESEMRPGQAFTKGWQVKNTGTCTWDTSYRLVLASGQKMGGEPVAVARQVAPGETYDFQVKLVSPLKPGDHQGVWQMVNGQNQAFGERLKVNVKVVSAPAPTPAPTQPPSPGISFTVDRTSIKHGECVVFDWKVDNVNAVYFYAEGERWQDHGVTGQESRRECPPVTINYHLRTVQRDNSVDVHTITIQVQDTADAPYIERFTVDPANQITLGQCVTVRWTVRGNVDKVTVWHDGNALWEGAPTQGNTQHCPERTGTASYSLEATAVGGATSRAQQNINVQDSAVATPAPTPEPDQPAIYGFTVSPNHVGAGECVDINWSAGGGTSHVRVLRDGAAIVDGGQLNGQGHECLDQPGTYSYRMEAYNPAGQSTAAEQRVDVVGGGANNPLANTRWRATRYWDGSQMAPVVAGSEPLTNFKEDGSIHGYAGCAEFGAEYHVNGSSLSIGGLNVGGKSCDEERTNQQNAFLGALQSTASFSLDGGQLFLLDGSGTALIEYVPR